MQSKILLYDIETSYIVAGVWGIWNVNAATVLQDWQILCFAWKWLGEKKVHVLGQDDFSDFKPGELNDKSLVEKLHELFSEADIVIAHNGNSFDQKKVQARMMIHHMDPPLPYKQIDTKTEMKKVAAHTSNKLSDLNRSLSLEHKLDAGGISTWTGCMQGDKKAFKKMKAYNKGDIVALEELYLLERPWMKTHPALNSLLDRPDACPKCGSDKIWSAGKYTATNTQKREYFRCGNCRGMVKPRAPAYRQAYEKMRFTNG